jgi:flagellar protein FliL
MADETKDAPESKPTGGSKVVPILLGVNMLLVVGVLALFMLKGGGAAGPAAAAGGHGEARPEAGAPAEGGPDAGPGPTTRMADFVIHLRDAEVDRYARISFEAELASELDKARFDRFTPRIRDGFITYLSDRTLEELRGSDQVRKVKAALQEQLKELAPGAKVRNLYVTDLVIQ